MQSFSFSDITNLITQFENETLPKEQWTHEAHLAVGCFYVHSFGKEEALNKIRINIKKYNIAVGGENTDSSGYHETITVFWIWNIDQFIKNQEEEKPVDEIIAQFIASSFSDKNYPFEYYTKDLLLSSNARLNFIEADLKAFE
ncbi:MAG: hypothetical protein U0U67_06585 [Chitinophagales bacterium]